MSYQNIVALLGDRAESLLTHRCDFILKEQLHLPSASFVDEVFLSSNRNPQVLKSLASIFKHGRLAHTGYLSILPVDQGVEHTAVASFSLNPCYFDPENIVKLALEGGCNAIAATFGTLATMARKYTHKIPCIVKLNHNELLTYPNKYDQTMFGTVEEAWNLGATAVGATIYFGSAASTRQLVEVSQAFERAHALGMATVLWCYVRNDAFKTEKADYHVSADITGQANYIGATIQADFIKQKLPDKNGGFQVLGFGKTHAKMYDQLTTLHPIDLCRYQVANCYMGRIGLINSGGISQGSTDVAEAISIAVINKRAGGMGLMIGRKAFQKSMKEGVALLHAIQNVYLAKEVTIA
ncbi:MAG: class I fructose-bisphosphate aldolase [Amoebophilaceae bacterium]|jgi:class I fructose-bisphosphate aldolase|nr:class I fructose-bisphosphate aldolase [Amoebophilaceae bacterium]